MFDSLAALTGRMNQAGATRIYVKVLAPNDNSKNQVYFGGDFSILNIFPHGDVVADNSQTAGSVRDRAKAQVDFSWLAGNTNYKAPNAQLILYPKYPEVRFSGFLKGCENAPSTVMKSRDPGRLLFLGVTPGRQIFGHAVEAGSALAREFSALNNLEQVGVLQRLPDINGVNSKSRLLSALLSICRNEWIFSQKLAKDGKPYPYSARNGGGYTLEAQLGISPNGNSEPDYLGWELKQYAVADFVKYRPKGPVTLLTPEPTSGVYKQEGFKAFMRLYGYADKSGVVGRTNFGGIYTCGGTFNANTDLALRMSGYDSAKGRITDFDGGVYLIDRQDRIAAFWQFTDIIEHWNRKHAQAAYVPTMFKSPPPFYRFGRRVLLCEGTDLSLFLDAIANGKIYLDPALKFVTHADGTESTKKRNQFRLKHHQLGEVYHKTETVTLDV